MQLYLQTFLLALLMASCADSDFEAASEERSDGVDAVFNRNYIMEDDFFRAGNAITADDLQGFLEQSPYGNRSWLASERVGGRRAADEIVRVSREFHINPLVLLARMQIENSIVAKAKRPSQDKIDSALGCGCWDGMSCNKNLAGLATQLKCAAQALEYQFLASEDESAKWRMNQSKATQDPLTVRPQNHATAALYAYTPWVMEGEGGNWLVWNVASKFETHAQMLGVLHYIPTAPLMASWTRQSDGTYLLQTLADDEIYRVRYLVDGIEVGRATRDDNPFFGSIRTFNYQGADRPFEVRGYSAEGDWIAYGNGSMDVTSDEGVYIQQADLGEYLIGIERPMEDTYKMQVRFEGEILSDVDTGQDTSTRLRTRLALPLEARGVFEVIVFGESGERLRSYMRELTIR